MAFNLREGFWGLEHLRLAFCRKLFNMPEDAFLGRYSSDGIVVEPCLDSHEKKMLCERCGFTLVRITFENSWRMEMCSALPLVANDNPVFRNWLTTLTKPGIAKSVETENRFEPILHER